MVDVPSPGVLASRCILQESRENDLLEEVDEGDITAVVAPLSETLFPYRLTTFFLTISFLTLFFCERLDSSTSSFISSEFFLYGFILSLSAVLISGVLLIVDWKLRALVRALKSLENSARKANRALLEREMLSFGLGLLSMRLHSTCRFRLFLCCRENVILLSELSKRLVSEEFMLAERGRLLNAFYTDEMRELVLADVDLDSSYITQRGIGTLLDMFVLHRSEVLRLIMLYLFRSPFPMAFSLILRLIMHVHAGVKRCITRFDAIANTLSLKHRNFAKIRPNRSEIDVTAGLNAVVFALDDIINGILDKRLTAVEVKRALNRLLLMSSLSDFDPSPPKEKIDGPTEQSTVFYERQENATLLDDRSDVIRHDEVFEVIASSNEAAEDSHMLGVSDDRVLQQSHELMQELRLALADRASEFAERERRALAAFYGVTGLPSRQSESMVMPDKHFQHEELLSREPSQVQGIGEGVTDAGQDGPSRQLPSDLLAALRTRSVVEETIGDQ